MKALAVAAVLVAAVVLFQIHGNAYSADGGESDEPAHLVTSLMVHDWIRAGMPFPPLAYAQNYYEHYPKVALGHWPPGLYAAEAAWMLLFGAGRTQALAFVAFCSVLLGWLFWREMRGATGWAPAALLAVCLVSLRPMRQSGWTMMADVPLALAWFGAMLAWRRYLDRKSWTDSVWFGLLASAATLTKVSGFALAVVPLVSLLLLRRWHMARRWDFWIAPVLVAVLCLPWYLFAPGAMYQSHEGYETVAFVARGPAWVIGNWASFLGPAVGLLVLVGMAAPHRWRGSSMWASAVGASVSAVVMATALPLFSTDTRFLVFSMAPLMLFAGWGAAWLVARPGWGKPAAVVVAVGLSWQIYLGAVDRARKDCIGMDEVAEALSAPEFAGRTVLVSSDAIGEGALIAEAALRDGNRPGRYALRSSKTLSSADWEGGKRELLARDAVELEAVLDRERVEFVVSDSEKYTLPPYPSLITEAAAASPERWRKLGVFPRTRPCVERGSPITVYQRVR